MQKIIKNIVIDIRMIEHTGIGVYIQSIINIILKNISDHNVILLINKNIDYSKYIDIENYTLIKITSPIYSIREQFEIPFKLGNNIDLYWSPHYIFPLLLRTKIILTVHDIYHIVDTSMNKIIRKFYCYIMFKIIKRKSLPIISVSKFTKHEIVRNFNINDENVNVVYNGLEDIWHSTKNYRDNNEILYVGTNKKHKNIELLINAFEKVNVKQKYNLVLIGKFDFSLMNTDINRYIKDNPNIIHIDQVERNDLLYYYNNAKLFVFPTLYEGFGFPPLEAMSCSCPTLVSDIDVLKEIYLDGTYYFKSNNINDLVDKMNILLENNDITNNVINKSKQVINRYSWDICGMQTTEIINNQLSL